MAAPQPSARLVRAVVAERAQLERHRARLTTEAGELRAALARIEHGLAEIDERCGLLDRLASVEAPAASARVVRAANGPSGAAGPRAAGGTTAAPTRNGAAAANGSGTPTPRLAADPLRGPAIREAAVRVLIQHGGDAIHYRAWFDLTTEAGYAIAGKDPLAVFLTQVSRSPAVRKGARAGVYEIDRDAGGRLRAQLGALERELRELTTHGDVDIATVRARRAQLNTEIARTERALEELTCVLPRA